MPTSTSSGPATGGLHPIVAGRGTALVTGATAGIGAAFAEELAAAGHDLVIVARDAPRLEAAATRLRASYGVDVEVLVADLSDAEATERVARRAGSRTQPVDVLVNNAGFGLATGYLDSDAADEARMLDVLVRAVLVVTQPAARAMRERGRGAIITVSSVAGFVPLGTYSAAKSWATAFMRSLAVELSGTGVSATAVCPGYVRTEFHERARIRIARQPWPLWMTPRLVAREGLRGAAQGRPVVVPSRAYRLAVATIEALPHRVVARASVSRRPERR